MIQLLSHNWASHAAALELQGSIYMGLFSSNGILQYHSKVEMFFSRNVTEKAGCLCL